MENLINIKSNRKHATLEFLIKKRDASQDMSRSAILTRAIKAAENVSDWNEVKIVLSKVEIDEEAPNFVSFQARYSNESKEILEKVKNEIFKDIEDLKILQTQYLVQLLLVNYLEELNKSALNIRKREDVEIELSIPEMVKVLVELIILDKDSVVLKEIGEKLLNWRNSR